MQLNVINMVMKNITNKPLILLVSLCSFLLIACSGSDIKDAIDLADGVPRKTIDVSRLGTNAFFNDGRFGTINQQFTEVRSTLGLRFVRVLFAWDNNVQPGPGATPDFSFYDAILANVPAGVDVLPVLTGVPSWVSNPANWVGGNPRATFARAWVRKVVERYGANPAIIGFQIWNEPNMNRSDNNLLELTNSPDNYVEMLATAHNIVKEGPGSKLVVSAATTSINQNFPASLDYNKSMRDAGAQAFLDVWGVHFYGKQYERVLLDGGVADFINGLDSRVWVTESGEQGVNSQLAYGEEVWPFLLDNMSNIERIYQYQFTEATPANSTYGLRNLTAGQTVSDLYVHLRDRA